MIENLLKNYFKIFSNKDLKGLNELFSDNVILQDWEIFAKGKKQVLQANQNIFDSVKSISVTLNELYIDKLVATCLIEVMINDDEKLKVIDIIKFNDDYKIIQISAYKQ